jgi:hypothetical protein
LAQVVAVLQTSAVAVAVDKLSIQVIPQFQEM